MVLSVLLTGMVTGGVWVAIVLLRRPRREGEPAPHELAEMRERLAELDQVQARLAEVEQRLDFTERLLAERRDAERLRPPEQ